MKPLNSGHLRVLKYWSVVERCWEVILERLSHSGLTVLSTIHGMSAIWDVRYCEVSLYKETDSRVIQPPASNFFYNSFEWCFMFFTYFSEQNYEFYSLIVKLKTLAVILPLAMLNYEPYVKPSVTLYLSMLLMYKKTTH